MALESNRFLDLPDIDDAPEVYETPELTDDASTLLTGTARSRSPSETSEPPVDGLDRSRVPLDQARTRFKSSRVDVRSADFSDRLTDARRDYRTGTRRHRRERAVITNDDEDGSFWSDDDVQESLARKLARLTREVEEVKAEYARQQEDPDVRPADDAESAVANLTKALAGVHTSQREAISAHHKLSQQLSRPSRPTPKSSSEERPMAATNTNIETPNSQVLDQLAVFESRITNLEQSLGLPDLDPSSGTLPILPTLSNLDKQLSLLTSSDAKQYLETLAAETKHLQPKPPAASGSIPRSDPPQTESGNLDPQLRSLYALIPTLTSQSRVLPQILARLSSLRLFHAGAEEASITIEGLEKRQQESEEEIRIWREGLGKVAEAVGKAEMGMKVNVETVEGWVHELEGRVREVLK